MIQIAKLSKYHLNELIAFFKAIVQINIDADAVALNIDAANDKLLSATKDMEAAYAYQKDSPITLELELLDEQRDDAVMGIKLVAQGFNRHFDPATKTNADTLLTCYNKYHSKLTKLNYNAETEEVDKLVNDFESDPSVAAALDALGCTPWVVHLKRVNEDFKTKYLARTAQYATQPAQSSGQLKPITIAAYEALIKRIDSLATLDTAGTYTLLISNINELIDQYNINVAKRTANNPPTSPPNP